jgi:phosphoglycerate dehydrogenase-like enzyme
MHRRVPLLIASPFEAEYVARIEAVDPCLEVLYEPDLLGRPRYPGDHTGAPFQRTPAQQARWEALLARAEIMWDFDMASMSNLLQRAPRLRWVQATSAGVGQFAKRHGLLETNLIITSASGVHAGPLAEFALMAMLMFTKDVARMERDRQARRWDRCAVRELAGQTVVIVGLGRIGSAVAAAARAFGVRTIGIVRAPAGRSAQASGVDQLAGPESLLELAPQADTLVICAPHTPQTGGLVSAEIIAALKPGAVVVNVGRGQVIDEEALLNALREGRLRGAALDVFHREPLPADSPFWELENVIISSHSASTGLGENARLTDLFADNLRRYLDEAPLRNVLNKDLLY